MGELRQTHREGLTASTSPKRYLTARRLTAISRMRVNYHLRQPLDFGSSETMRGEESWFASFRLDGETVCGVRVHRIPLCSGYDVAFETEMGDDVPGWPVTVTTEGDQPRPSVLRRLGDFEPEFGDRFLVVENPDVIEVWQGVGLDALLLGVALNFLSRPTDLFAVAEPAPIETGLRPSENRALRAINVPALELNGFRRFKSGTWLLTFPGYYSEEYEGLLARYGVSGVRS